MLKSVLWPLFFLFFIRRRLGWTFISRIVDYTNSSVALPQLDGCNFFSLAHFFFLVSDRFCAISLLFYFDFFFVDHIPVLAVFYLYIFLQFVYWIYLIWNLFSRLKTLFNCKYYFPITIFKLQLFKVYKDHQLS